MTRAARREWRKRSARWNVTSRLRKRLDAALKSAKTQKAHSVLDLIGCTPEHLMKHLEAQFSPGMNWNNRADWHIDHIRPCASFDLTDPDQQKACFHFTNLRPLSKEANASKHARLTLLI